MKYDVTSAPPQHDSMSPLQLFATRTHVVTLFFIYMYARCTPLPPRTKQKIREKDSTYNTTVVDVLGHGATRGSTHACARQQTVAAAAWEGTGEKITRQAGHTKQPKNFCAGVTNEEQQHRQRGTTTSARMEGTETSKVMSSRKPRKHRITQQRERATCLLAPNGAHRFAARRSAI